MAPAAGAGRSKNRFAWTCARLRQYLWEQQQQKQREQSMADLARVFQRAPPLPPAAATVHPVAEDLDDRKTLQLFPVQAGMERVGAEEEGAPKKAPLTISYNGHVVVFRDFPADKADELMRIAGGMTVPPPETQAPPAVPVKPPQQPAAPVMTKVLPIVAAKKLKATGPAADEPEAACDDGDEDGDGGKPSIARKMTVQRFLQKRKYSKMSDDDYDYFYFGGAGGKHAEDDDEPPAAWLRL